jgi:hypothetical protein
MPNIGAGTSFSYSTDGGSTYNVIARITKFTPAKLTVAKVSNDAMDNTLFNGLPVEDQIPGWVSPGTWGATMFFAKTAFATIRGLTGTQEKWKVIKSDGSGYTFSGYISEISDEVPLKELLSADITVQINGGSVAVFAASQS